MYVPISVLVTVAAFLFLVVAWLILVAVSRNPLPFPDRGSRIFSAATPEAKDAVVALLALNGVPERFQFNSRGVLRSIMWDGTIINHPDSGTLEKLGNPSSSIGIVARDPEASARAAADFLRNRGCSAEVVLDAEPELPIAFVVTNALPGTVINFRKHVIHLPRPTAAPKRAH